MDARPGSQPVDDGGPSEVGTSSEAGEATDHSVEPAEGEPAEGEPAEGEPAEGEPAEGEPAEGRDPLRFNSWMKRSATGALMTGIAVGLQQALELPRQEQAFVIEASGEPEDPNRPIDLRFDPESPADTVAIIRRPATPPAPDEPTDPG